MAFTNNKEGDDKPHWGLVAQEAEIACPGAGFVCRTETGRLGLAYSELIAPLISLAQEHEARLVALEAPRATRRRPSVKSNMK